PGRRGQVIDRAHHAGGRVVGGQRSPVGHSVTVMANPQHRSGLPEAAIEELRAAIGDDSVVTDPDRLASVEVDWTGRFQGTTPVLLRPRSADDVAAALAWCHRARVAVVPQGGNTGLVGGSVPLHGEVVMSLGRLDSIGEVDPLAGQLTAGAG